jgi:hypothetical protein
MQNDLIERLQELAETLDEAVDHIEILEAILAHLEKSHPDAVDRARASVAASTKDRHV